MKTSRVTRSIISPLIPLLAAASAWAGSFVGFETVGPNAATDALVLADQFRPAQGIRFSRADGGSVTLAKSGAPFTAFAAGQDTATYTAGDSLLGTDPWASSVGDFYVRLSGTAATVLVIDYDYPTAAAAGLLLDVDADETWVIRAYSDAGTTLVAETILTGGSPGTGDQTATPWAIVRPSADIVQLRIVQTGANANAGAALDLFFPYGTFDFSGSDLALKLVSGPSPSVGLQLSATPGHRVRVETTDSLDSGNWTLDQALTPAAPYTALTSSGDSSTGRRFYRAYGPSPEMERADAIYAAVSAFLDTLTADQRNSIIYPANDTTQRARWSNFPTGIFQRNGLKIGSMTSAQTNALYAMLRAAFSPEGYQKIIGIVEADEVLRTQSGGGNLIFGRDEYYVSFVGTPSLTNKYLLQFGGHHFAVNVTIKGAQATIAPALPGAQPASYTLNGRSLRPLGDEYYLSFALLNSMTTAQRSAAVLSSAIGNLVLGPGQDGVTVLPEGIKASDLTAAQRAILLDLIGKYVNIIHDDAAATKMASIRANIADPTDATYFLWRGPTTAGSAAYFRVQGPNLFIEFSPQSMGGNANNHIHAMYREFSNDYGAQIVE
ncbi:MAG: DUF3500 domain-containing protein [Verrucomicrobiales bacterium]|nr:DUF3500 domain-containing protein [Verrucomicrobiales bacterium]